MFLSCLVLLSLRVFLKIYLSKAEIIKVFIQRDFLIIKSNFDFWNSTFNKKGKCHINAAFQHLDFCPHCYVHLVVSNDQVYIRR